MDRDVKNKNLLLVGQFGELQSYCENLINYYDTNLNNTLETFLRFAANQEECRLKWLQAENDLKKSVIVAEEAKKEKSILEGKLVLARKLIDQEKSLRKQAEERCELMVRQLQMVKELLFTDNNRQTLEETKEKLKFLNTNTKYSCDGNANRLNRISELDSTESVISDLSYSRSEEELDISYSNRPRFRKHRPSLPHEFPVAAKRSRHSSNTFKQVEINTKDSDTERVIATTTVAVELNGNITASSQIETIPTSTTAASSSVIPPIRAVEPSAPPHSESPESTLSVTSTNRGTNNNVPHHNLGGVFTLSTNMLNSRTHHLISKTALRPDLCIVCEKRIKFGSTVLRCQDCKASSHPSCKNNLPLPCIPPGTPSGKGIMGVIADYTPQIAPMVPSIVVHCINEIETRGLTETGIYRISGSDREVKELKEKFLRNRGVPNLSVIADIHVICGCLKEFLRSLREPLVTYGLWWKFVAAVKTRDDEMRKAKLYQVVSELPKPNKDTLAYVIQHLHRVADVEENKMTVNSLSRVFAPTIVGYSSPDIDNVDIYSETKSASEVMEELLNIPCEYWEKIISQPQELTTPTTQGIIGNTLSAGFLSTPHGARTLRNKRKFFPNTPA